MVRRATTLRTVADLLFWERLLADGQRAALLDVPCPDNVLGVSVPKSLDGLTLEELARLWDIKTSFDLFTIAGDILLHKGKKTILKAELLPMLGFANFVSRELERINDLWASIPHHRTSEETMAGADSLKFGVFGIADWYARRMGITNHDEAFATPWVRVYQCMRNDALEGEYRRRLNDILSKQHKK